jgi:hypothetical protein
MTALRRSSLTDQEARAEALAAGYEPLEPYPGRICLAWKTRCTTCGAPRRMYLNWVRNNSRRCHHLGTPLFTGPKKKPKPVSKPARPGRRIRPEQAEKELREAGYEPLVPYPNNSKTPWLARCTTCGQERTPNMDTIRAKRRCKHLPPKRDGWLSRRQQST